MEWLTFAWVVVFEVLVLYVPGALVVKAFRGSLASAIIFAPLVSIGAYSMLAILYHFAGIPSNWATLALVVAFAGCVACVGSRLLRTRKVNASSGRAYQKLEEGNRFTWVCVASYAAIGLVITTVVFASCFDTPSSFIQTFDNAAHLNMIQSLAESGDYSTLSTTVFPEVEPNEFVDPQKSYYPAAWHGLAAMAYGVFGGSAAIAENGLLFALAAIVYPISMLGLLLRLFPERKKGIIAGSLIVLGFAAFPWRFLTFGPLFSNLLAYSIMPLIAASFISMLQVGIPVGLRMRFAGLFLAGMICVVSTQPNSLFAVAVFLIPFCFVKVMHLADRVPVKRIGVVGSRIVYAVAYVILVCALWLALYSAPFLQGVVQYPHDAGQGFLTALKHVADLHTVLMGPQPVLALLVVLGVVYTIWRQRRSLWVSVSYVLFAVLYLTCVCIDGPLQHLLAGFWYSDFYRLAACLAIFGVPLACLGVECVVDFAMAMHERFRKEQPSNALKCVALALVCVVFVVGNYGSMFFRPLGVYGGNFDHTRDLIRDLYANDSSQSLTEEEKRFVDQVAEVIPEGSRILNMPYDGSVFAYGYNGLNTYFREYNATGMATQPAQAALLRLEADRLTVDDEIAAVMDGSDIAYLLLLDYGEGEGATLNAFSYEPSAWDGIRSVYDGAPGFELVLSEGDMRLYRIVLPEEANADQ